MTELFRATLDDIAREAVPPADVADTALALAGRRRARRRAIAPAAALAAVTGVAVAVTLTVAPSQPGGRGVKPVESPSTSVSVTSAPSAFGPGSVPSRLGKLTSSVPSVLTHPIARAAVMYDVRDGSVILLSADGGAVRRLRPTSERGFHPVAFSLSPDGTKVAYGWTRDDFSGVRPGHAGTELRIVTLSTGSTAALPLLGSGLGEQVDDIQWSGDSSSLLVRADEVEQVAPGGASGPDSMAAAPPAGPSKLAAPRSRGAPSPVLSGSVSSRGWGGQVVGFVCDVRSSDITATVSVTVPDWTLSADGSTLLEYSLDFSQHPQGLQVVDLAGHTLSWVPVAVRAGEGRAGTGGIDMTESIQAWSPDQKLAAEIYAVATPGSPLNYDDGSDRPFVLRAFSLLDKDSSGNAVEVDVQLGSVKTAYLLGWADDTHVLVATMAHDGSQTVSSVDVATGARTTAMTVSASAKAGLLQVANAVLRAGGFRAMPSG